jgi:hypothetical protein
MPIPAAMTQMPGPPPDIASQMGAPGLQAAADRQQGPPSSPNPHAAIMAQADAVKAVLEQMAQLENVFAPFARQAINAITQGVSAVSSAPPMGLPQEMPAGPTPPGGPGQFPSLA